MKKTIDVEYCHSGFLGYPLVVFLWDGNIQVATLLYNENGECKVSVGLKTKKSMKLTPTFRFWVWLQHKAFFWLNRMYEDK